MLPSALLRSVEPYMLFNGQYLPNRLVLRRTAIIEATVGSNGLSVPMGVADNGMPVGIQIQTRPGGRIAVTLYPELHVVQKCCTVQTRLLIWHGEPQRAS